MIKAIKLKKIVIFVILFFIIFAILYYKNFLFGNNIIKNRSSNKNEDVLYHLENYTAEANITVTSNKTQNSYVVKQEVSSNYSMQEVIKGESIEGVKIEISEGNLKVSNSKLNLEKVYENYHDLLNNSLFLNTFVADYKEAENETKCEQQDEQMIMEVKLNKNQNTYIQYKKLYLDTKTGKPQKLEVQDNTKKETICIVYNNIEFK